MSFVSSRQQLLPGLEVPRFDGADGEATELHDGAAQGCVVLS